MCKSECLYFCQNARAAGKIYKQFQELAKDCKNIEFTWPDHEKTKKQRDVLLEVLKDLMDMRHKCFIPNEHNWWDKKAKAAILETEK